jgi:hypothetical protein
MTLGENEKAVPTPFLTRGLLLAARPLSGLMFSAHEQCRTHCRFGGNVLGPRPALEFMAGPPAETD